MLSRLILPPGFTVRIDYDPALGRRDATFIVSKNGAWVGGLTVPVARLDHPDDLEEFADQLMKRGIRTAGETRTARR